MKAVRWYGRGDVRIEEVKTREPVPHEVCIRVDYAGICASDLHEYTSGPQFIPIKPHPVSGRSAPITMGHEFTGTIVDVGRDVKDLRKGDRVVAEGTLPCGECPNCGRKEYILCRKGVYLGFAWDGAFAEYCTLPAIICHKVPDPMDSADAVLIEPLAVGLHAVRRGRVQAGDTVAIIGTGTIGLSTLLSARVAGASRIFTSDRVASKRSLALQLGAEQAFNPADGDVTHQILEATGVGVDVAFECVGSNTTVVTATQSARIQGRKGRTVLVGIPVQPQPFSFLDIVASEREVIGSCGYHFDEYPMVMALMADHRIDPRPLITKHINLDQIVEQGFKPLTNPQNENIKIVMRPSTH